MARQKVASRPVSCAECGKAFDATRRARFCSVPHRRAFAKRMQQRGAILAPYVMAWIAGRGGGHAGTHPVAAKALSEITAITRTFIEEDKAANPPRPPVLGYVEGVFAEGFLYCDRKRG